MSMSPRRMLPGALAMVVVAAIGMFTVRPSPDPGETDVVAARFAFEIRPLNTAPAQAQHVRVVAPDLSGIRSWISAVGAAVALLDADGNRRQDDVCLVDPRDDSVRVFPVPGTGDRYPAASLTPPPGPMDHIAPMGCVPTDLDADGDSDLIVYYWGRSPVQFLRVGVGWHPVELVQPPQVWNTTALVVGDLDGDGAPDVLAGNYFPDGARVLDPGAAGDGRMRMQASMADAGNGGTNRAFLSRPGPPDTAPAWLDASIGVPDRVARSWTLAFGMQDLTGDLLPEVYLANDFGPDHLLVNHSRPGQLDLRPVVGERTALLPKSKVLGRGSFKGMGVTYTYPDGAELPTIVVSNITTPWGLQESNFAFIPTGPGADLLDGRLPYEDRSEALGLSRSGWAWDVKAVDFDGDGNDELLQATGFVAGKRWRWPELQELAMINDQLLQHPWAWPHFRPGDDISGHQANVLWTRHDGRYVDIAAQSGLGYLDVSRGIAIGDVDFDGRPDALVANQWQDSRLVLNRSRSTSQSTLVLKRAGEGGRQPTVALGASVVARPGGGRPDLRAQLYPSNGHAGVSSPELFFAVDGITPFVVSWRTADGVRTAQVSLGSGRHELVLHDDGRVTTR